MKYITRICRRCKRTVLLARTDNGWMALDPLPEIGGGFDYVMATRKARYIPPPMRQREGRPLPYHYPHRATCGKPVRREPPKPKPAPLFDDCTTTTQGGTP